MDFKDIEQQLQERSKQKISALFNTQAESELIFLLGKSDSGVARNGGRRGARFSPDAILNCLKNMSFHRNVPSSEKILITQKKEESLSFSKSQELYQEQLEKEIVANKTHIHIGGGHDHVYPLLKALEKNHQKITVINIDAHCDTRPDQLVHSGTPFRQFAKQTNIDFELIQLGIHQFANTPDTMQDLENGKMTIYGVRNLPKDFHALNNYLDEIIKVDKDRLYLISLDCDAIESSAMQAVSAVNHEGLSLEQVRAIFYWGKYKAKSKYFGIYEYNPIFDDLSQKGARALSSLVYELFY